MLRALPLLLILMAVPFTAQAQVDCGCYKWSLSGSSTDPNQNVAAPVFGLSNVYLWLVCEKTQDGVSAMECAVTATNLTVTGFTPLAGVLNAGTPTELLLAIGGCPTPDFVAGFFAVADFVGTGGALCLTDSGNGVNVSVNCDVGNPVAFTNDFIGFASDGSAVCLDEFNCEVPVSVDPSSWGSVKNLYR